MKTAIRSLLSHLFRFSKAFLRRVFIASHKNLQNAPVLLRWTWLDWVIVVAMIIIGPISLLFLPIWLGMKLSIGEDLRQLLYIEKAFNYQKQEMERMRYQLGVLKRRNSVTDVKNAQAEEVSNQIESTKRR